MQVQLKRWLNLQKTFPLLIICWSGCGKTTQVAQFILDDAIERGNGSITKVVCTQPRRISAVSVAERVAAERGEGMGKSVGYQIRLEKFVSIPTIYQSMNTENEKSNNFPFYILEFPREIAVAYCSARRDFFFNTCKAIRRFAISLM